MYHAWKHKRIFRKANLRMTIQSEISKIKYKVTWIFRYLLQCPHQLLEHQFLPLMYQKHLHFEVAFPNLTVWRAIHSGRNEILIMFTAMKLYRTFTYQVMFILDNLTLRIDSMLLYFKKCCRSANSCLR